MPDQEPEQGFTVRDRRRGSAESEAPTPPPVPTPIVPEPAPSAPAAESQEALTYQNEDEAGGMEEIGFGDENGDPNALPDVYSVLALFLGELRNMAWLRMGLVANPATGQFEIDFDQAKIAINTVGFLASQLESVIAPEEKLPLRALVSDLQVNFAEQVKRSNSGS